MQRPDSTARSARRDEKINGGSQMLNQFNILETAKSAFSDLTPAEERLFKAIEQGEVADFCSENDEANNPEDAEAWQAERIIRAKCLSWIFHSKNLFNYIGHRGIWLHGARIDGELDLSFMQFPFALVAERCSILSDIYLLHSEIQIISLSGSVMRKIQADFLKVRTGFHMRDGSKVRGEIRLVRAHIGANLDFSNSQFISRGGDAIIADGIKIDGDLILSEYFKSEGKIRFMAADIGGNMECGGAQFINAKSVCISADGIRVKGYVRLNKGFTAQGEVRLPGAEIGGDLECSGGHFLNRGKPALSAFGARIKGSVFLDDGFLSEGEVNLSSAELGSLECTNCHMINGGSRALRSDGIKVRGGVYLRDHFIANGEIFMQGAEIGGNLECSSAHFINPKSSALNANGMTVSGQLLLGKGFKADGQIRLAGGKVGSDLVFSAGHFSNEGSTAILASAIKIGGSLLFGEEFIADGEVSLDRAEIAGDFQCTNAWLNNPGAHCLCADGIRVGGNVAFRDGCRSEGEIRFSEAHIGGTIGFESASMHNDNHDVISADRMKIVGGIVFRNFTEVEGIIRLTGAEIGGEFEWRMIKNPELAVLDLHNAKARVLSDEPSSWPAPGRLILHSFIYDTIELDSPLSAELRLNWLSRQPKQWFLPQPYEQLALVLAKMGRDEESRKVLIAKSKDRASRIKPLNPDFLWYHIFGPLIGYGYRPFRALLLAMVIFILGTAIFQAAYDAHIMMPRNNDSAWVQDFNAVIYSLDAFLPIIDLYQADHWIPKNGKTGEISVFEKPFLLNGTMIHYYLCLHILSGWVLTLLFVGSVTGLIRK